MTDSAEDSELEPKRAAELLEDGGAELIDVRTMEEHEAARIDGDRHIELDVLAAEAASIPKDRTVVFYCRTGARSAMATEAFRTGGYDAYNLSGGIKAWVAEGLPIEPADGEIV